MARCKCAECRKVFKSLSLFDKHIGTYKSRYGPDGRVCLTSKKLEKLGMIEKDGVWMMGAMPPGAFTIKNLAKKTGK